MDKVLQRFTDGATYEGNLLHSVINYALILLAVLPYLTGRPAGKSRWYGVLVISVIIQVAMWFSMDAAGVSLIWSALAGYNLLFYKRNRSLFDKNKKLLFIIHFISVLAAIFYYLIILPPITTIAHLTALLMGMGLYYLFKK